MFASGLQLILNIDQDEYIKETGDTAGARLVVHTQNSMPFPEDEGITVTPGQATSIGVRQVVAILHHEKVNVICILINSAI